LRARPINARGDGVAAALGMIKGLMGKGGTARVEAARRLLADAGGTLEGFY
jgi:hypothetical protein